ncbi:hypothetical protein C8R46DRAFT_1044364 [Mycena filopes]|nr:hypothetical protein C8R46DRAFT_1044364 [Mycena filopes]
MSYRKPQLVRSREWWRHQHRRNAERKALASILQDDRVHDGFNGQAIVTFVPGSTVPTQSILLSTGKVMHVDAPAGGSIERSTTAARPSLPRPKRAQPLNRSGKTWEQEDAETLARLTSQDASQSFMKEQRAQARRDARREQAKREREGRILL